MGYAVGTACYESQAEAEAVYFGTVSPSVSGSTVTQYVLDAGVWKLNRYDTTTGSMVLQSSTTAFSLFPTCSNADRVMDGITLGWLVAGVLFTAYSLKLLRRAL
ncbi:hypothetical protein NH8B_2274 [Pseudogulbenkiania sp. NH8B]|uniref:hypothetical protein n=1 Tax=Pseudogulbenkiania sp. (strain NH8B) TaxID=748280 RepID=UPI0002279D98|nr:hypothetical protein [Pseudogulbenkiania sp. NH8B]BAK77088.1 hypothetical protein NH8B_2274 [Pseudogulbenkiania sp. NH8B]